MSMADAFAVCDAVTRTASRTLRKPISVHQRLSAVLGCLSAVDKSSGIGHADAGAPVLQAWYVTRSIG